MIPAVIHVHRDHFPTSLDAVCVHFLQIIHGFVGQLCHFDAVLTPVEIVLMGFHPRVNVGIAVGTGEECHQAAGKSRKGVPQRSGVAGGDVEAADLAAPVRMTLPVDQQNGFFQALTGKLNEHHLAVRLGQVAHCGVILEGAEVGAGGGAVGGDEVADKVHAGKFLLGCQDPGRSQILQRLLGGQGTGCVQLVHIPVSRVAPHAGAGMGMGSGAEDLLPGDVGGIGDCGTDLLGGAMVTGTVVDGEDQNGLLTFTQSDTGSKNRLNDHLENAGLRI